MSFFQVALGRSRPPDPPALTSYVDRVLALSPHLYLPDGRNKHASVAGPTGTAVNSPQTGVTSLAQDDASGSSTGFSGVTTSAPHVTVPSPLSGASITLHILFQVDNIATKAKHVLATHSGGAAVGQISIEVLAGGHVRCWSDTAAGTHEINSSILFPAGVIQQGRAHSIVYQRQSDIPGWSQRVYVDGVLVAADTTQRPWPIFAAGTFYLGTWWDGANFLDPTDGLIAHVAGWNSLLTPVQIADLARAQSVAWAVDVDAGAVQAGNVVVVNIDQQVGTHGRQPITVSAGDGALVTTNELFNSIEITAGGTAGTNDTFTYSFTDADGRVSPTRTVTIDVTAAAAGVSIGALTAFQSSRIQVTALPGWPGGGRTPKDVVTQGTHAHGYVRRAWKPTDFNGTYMDFQAGWRKTSAPGVVRIKLDNNSEIDLSYTVAHTIPAGTPRYLDRLATGANNGLTEADAWIDWQTAIQGMADNQVLVVRARAGIGPNGIGNWVYPIDSQTSNITSTASGVKVVAHPDDLAAGRRPRVHRQGTSFARFADDLNNGRWELDPGSPGNPGGNLGGTHGTVWRSVQTFTNPDRYGVSYRTVGGGIRRLWIYTNTDGVSIAMSRLRDRTYPRISTAGAVSSWVLYMGPGIYWNSTDSRFYIRLNSLVAGRGAIQVNAAVGGNNPNPPFNWSDDGPASEDPNQCELFISSTQNQSAEDNTVGFCLQVNSQNNWLVENVDFVGGGGTIRARNAAGTVLRGCRILGWAPPTWTDTSGFDTFDNQHQMLEVGTGSMTCDRCEFWGGAVPWGGVDENKQRHGAYSAGQKSNLFNPLISTGTTGSLVLRHCLIDGFWTTARNDGGIGSLKHHHCRLRYVGMDGSYAMDNCKNAMHYLRCQIFEGTLYSPLGGATDGGSFHLGYCLWTNVRPFIHGNGYWASNEDGRPNEFICGGGQIAHGDLKWFARQFHYNNTGIGAHNHRKNNMDKRASGGSFTAMTHDGNGAGVTHPWCRVTVMLEFRARNNIAAVFPNGSEGDTNGLDVVVVGASGGSSAGYCLNAASFAGTLEQDYNRYYRAPGVPNVNLVGAVTYIRDSDAQEFATDAIATVRTNTGRENNGSIGAPGFAAAFDAAEPDSVIHRNAQWVLTGTGAAAAAGGNTASTSWPDVDFGTEITYTGPGWLGCMDPLASAIEQQVGPLGPLPSGL